MSLHKAVDYGVQQEENSVSVLQARDERPVPPERPADSECCQSGCDPCVFDFYYEELEAYRQALKAWEARQKT
nr:oxidoreductase [Pseudomonas sp.]